MIKSRNLLYIWHLAFLLTLTRANTFTAPQPGSGCACDIASKIFDYGPSCKGIPTNIEGTSNTIPDNTASKTITDSVKEAPINFPALFVAHGAPSLVIENHDYVTFLRQLGATLPKPTSIVLFSAHWESPIQKISSIDQYSTIYDFHGFPKEMYSLTYPAKGNKDLAKEIQSLFADSGIESVLDHQRGLDHGAWCILKLIYPNADIPVVALSVNPHLSTEMLYKTGEAVKSLKKKGALIIGSGGTVHNLGRVSWGSMSPDKWAEEFDNWLAQKVYTWEKEDMFDYMAKAPYARDAVPAGGTEHFVPFLIAMGAGADEKKAKKLHQSYQYGSLSLATWMFD